MGSGRDEVTNHRLLKKARRSVGRLNGSGAYLSDSWATAATHRKWCLETTLGNSQEEPMVTARARPLAMAAAFAVAWSMLVNEPIQTMACPGDSITIGGSCTYSPIGTNSL